MQWYSILERESLYRRKKMYRWVCMAKMLQGECDGEIPIIISINTLKYIIDTLKYIETYYICIEIYYICIEIYYRHI
jgi:hypothetical protein